MFAGKQILVIFGNIQSTNWFTLSSYFYCLVFLKVMCGSIIELSLDWESTNLVEMSCSGGRSTNVGKTYVFKIFS